MVSSRFAKQSDWPHLSRLVVFLDPWNVLRGCDKIRPWVTGLWRSQANHYLATTVRCRVVSLVRSPALPATATQAASAATRCPTFVRSFAPTGPALLPNATERGRWHNNCTCALRKPAPTSPRHWLEPKRLSDRPPHPSTAGRAIAIADTVGWLHVDGQLHADCPCRSVVIADGTTEITFADYVYDLHGEGCVRCRGAARSCRVLARVVRQRRAQRRLRA